MNHPPECLDPTGEPGVDDLRRLNLTLAQRLEERTAELQALRAEKESFIHSVCHDLRGPLMHIGGFADLLRDHAGAHLDDLGRSYLQTVTASADQLGQMLAEIMVHSRRIRTAPASAPATTPEPDLLNGGSRPPLGKPAATHASGTLHILLVEDSVADVALIRHTLLGFGQAISLTHIETREAFERELTSRPPELILSDYLLPTFDGGQALEIAQRLVPHVPFIFVTGTLGEEVAIDMLKQGATDYVLKNRLMRLTSAVRRALSEAGQRRDREHAEDKLQRSHDQLRALTGHLQSVREEERTRIAREVHDELGQALTGLKLDLAWLAGQLRGPRTLQRKLKTMSGQIDATILTVRRIATELRPGVLDSLGLAAAIEWQGAEFQERTGLRCDVRLDLAGAAPDQRLSTACFRIFQETLTNIIRHAQATRVEVGLVQDAHELVLTVRDNGRGITEKEIARASSIGLIGMKERAAQVGGELQFTGEPGGGTTVTLRVPLSAIAPPGP